MKLHQRLLIALLAILPGIQNAAIIYVTEAGGGSLNGTSWINSYPGTSLQLAINSANPGDEIWVEEGTYFTTSGPDRTIAFSMKNGVSIYGSFLGTENLLSERIIYCGPKSILSGFIGTASNTDNSYKVIRNLGLNNTAVLDGFVVTGGYDERPATSVVGLGGGILNVGSGAGNFCSPTIRNCVITRNQSEFGAGIFNDGYNGGAASPTIENCLIVDNHATGGGGGIDNFGLLNGNASPIIWNTVIANNTADNAAGGMYCWGGNNGNASPTLINCVVANNTVTSGNGGGIVADRSNSGGGGGGASGTADPTFRNSIIRGNTANTSPQFHLYGGSSFIVNYCNIDTNLQIAPHTILPGIANQFNSLAFLQPSTHKGQDSCWMTDDDGYHIQMGSSHENTGDSTLVTLFDLAFHDRVAETNVDLGAYENQPMTFNIQQEEFPILHLYPNPVTSLVTINSSASVKGLLLNSIGEEVNQINLIKGENIIDLSELSSGIYILVIPQNSTTRRIIKL